jgi:hypothetical protein
MALRPRSIALWAQAISLAMKCAAWSFCFECFSVWYGADWWRRLTHDIFGCGGGLDQRPGSVDPRAMRGHGRTEVCK